MNPRAGFLGLSPQAIDGRAFGACGVAWRGSQGSLPLFT